MNECQKPNAAVQASKYNHNFMEEQIQFELAIAIIFSSAVWFISK